jgi:hypothetical protein
MTYLGKVKTIMGVAVMASSALVLFSVDAQAQKARPETQVRTAKAMNRFSDLTEAERVEALKQGGVPVESLMRQGKTGASILATYRSLDNIAPALVRASTFDLSNSKTREVFEALTAKGPEAVEAAAQVMSYARSKGMHQSKGGQALVYVMLKITDSTSVNGQRAIELLEDYMTADEATLKNIIRVGQKFDEAIEKGKTPEEAWIDSFGEYLVQEKGLSRIEARELAKKRRECRFGA